jgi:hypothetical protein
MSKTSKDDTIKSVTVTGGQAFPKLHTPITSHSGSKYLRKIYPADGVGEPIWVDVYEVGEAFVVTGGPLNHALKKILCPGQRGKGGRAQDIKEAIDALSRAYEMELRGGKEGV